MTFYFRYGNIATMETLNQREVAKYLGISESYLSKILSGKSQPRKKILLNLSKKTNSKPEIWIFGTRSQKESALIKAIVKLKSTQAE